MSNLIEMDPLELNQRYAVYSVRNTLEDGLTYTRSFIVIRNGYGVIVRFTHFQEYARDCVRVERSEKWQAEA